MIKVIKRPCKICVKFSNDKGLNVEFSGDFFLWQSAGRLDTAFQEILVIKELEVDKTISYAFNSRLNVQHFNWLQTV